MQIIKKYRIVISVLIGLTALSSIAYLMYLGFKWENRMILTNIKSYLKTGQS